MNKISVHRKWIVFGLAVLSGLTGATMVMATGEIVQDAEYYVKRCPWVRGDQCRFEWIDDLSIDARGLIRALRVLTAAKSKAICVM